MTGLKEKPKKAETWDGLRLKKFCIDDSYIN